MASTVVAWGNPQGAFLPNDLTNVVAVNSGVFRGAAVKSSGEIVWWGSFFGTPHPPTPPSGVAAVSLGGQFGLALCSNGTVVAWGDNYFGEAIVPAGLTGVVAVAAGYRQSVVLKSDGTVFSWGQHGNNVPADLSGVVAISANLVENYFHALALKGDGTVVAWGRNDYGERDVPGGLSNVVAISAGGYHSLALKSGGTVATWGGQDSAVVTPPSGLSNVTAIAAGGWHNLALQSDGTVVGWQSSSHTNLGSNEVPLGLSNVVAISAGLFNSVALTGLIPPIITRQPQELSLLEGDVSSVSVGVMGTAPFRYQWQKDGIDIQGATNAGIAFNNAQSSDAGDYRVLVSNDVGSLMSQTATVTVAPRIEILIQPQSQIVDAGTNVTLSVTVVGSAPFTYQWRKNRASILGATEESLTLPNAQPSDSGSYSVVVSKGAVSVISSAAKLLVRSLVGPNITAHPQPVTVWLGAKASLSVAATGIAPLGYQWLKDGAALSAETGTTLAFDNVQSSDAGTYSVVVSDTSGSVTSASALLALVAAPVRTTPPPGTVVSLGGPLVPAGINDAVAVAAGSDHGLALRSDGTVVGWGGRLLLPGSTTYSEPPAGLSNVVAISAGDGFSLALKSDGTLVTWGLGPALPGNLVGVTAIDAGNYAMALKADGTVVKWPGVALPAGNENVVAISVGSLAAMALRSDGTITAIGSIFVSPILNNLRDAAAVSVGGAHYLVLKSNGTVLDYGDGSDPPNTAPSGLSNVVSIAAGDSHSLALKNDGSVVGWNGANVPSGLTNVSTISAGRGFSLLITTNPPVPMLAARRAGGQMLLSAPIAVSGYILEATDDFTSPFSPVDVSTNTTVSGEIDNAALMLNTSGAKKFYRLRKIE